MAILLMPSRRVVPGAARRVDPKPPVKLPQVHSIHGIVLPGTSSRPRRTPGTSPAPRRQVCPRPQRCPKSSTKALRPGHPAHNTGMRPIQESKNKNTPKIATFLRLRIAAGRQNTDEARKMANWTRGGPFPPRKGRKGVRNRKKVAQKSEFLFLRDGSSQRSIPCERRVRPRSRSGQVASRDPATSTRGGTRALASRKDRALGRLNSPPAKTARWSD